MLWMADSHHAAFSSTPSMNHKPNYETLRAEAGFTWFVGSAYLALLELTGVAIREFNLNPQAGIEVYREGRPMLREMFGEGVKVCGISTPPISYGHANGLGAALTFPEGGEVAHEHIYASLQEGIDALKGPVDFASAGMAPFYLDYRCKLQEAFPREQVGFGFGFEGPWTTAYELRGEEIFYDLMDQPEETREFLQLVTESILRFHRFRCDMLDEPVIHPDAANMPDDIASMVPARMWSKMVLPYWDRYYRGKTLGRRFAHVEDLRRDQLQYLEEACLARYDPGVSPKLNPPIIRDSCRVPFGWRLASFHYPHMSCRDVEDFVLQAAADGASLVFTIVSATMCNPETAEKVRAFVRAGKQVDRMFADGATREQLGARVSEEGKETFWNQWPPR